MDLLKGVLQRKRKAAADDFAGKGFVRRGILLPPAPDLPRHEVVRRLRVLRQPATLFGEDDDARAERFKAVLKYGLFHDVDDLNIAEGQTNEFLRDVIETRKRRKVAAGRDTSAKGRRVGGGAGGNSADEDDGDGDDDDEKRMNANFEELCEEDRILVFFKRLLNECKQQLDAMTELEKATDRREA
ncbi:hypothetical protein QOZ80_7AG0571060 [Eleusine coracana subsp. coracana]|nr:hypothetical protein QOZ80_7AG0571060 [Eleusine coracana subsp. coracana]